KLIAAHFPKPDVPERLCPVPEQTRSAALTGSEPHVILLGAEVSGEQRASSQMIRPGTEVSGEQRTSSRLEPLSASRWSVQFTASAELHAKIERARELLSHAVPGGDLAVLFERALDE